MIRSHGVAMTPERKQGILRRRQRAKWLRERNERRKGKR
jgi:hypothetical protein